MTTESLLVELNAVPDADRVRRMVGIGQQARTDAEVAAILRALAAGGFYERRLALFACFGSGDGDQALSALTDPSRFIRGTALKLIPIVCTDIQVTEALEAVSTGARLALLPRLYRRRRSDPVDAFLDSLAMRGDDQLGPLLSFGSYAVVRRHLDAVLPRFGADDWQRLARRHPDIALQTLVRMAKELAAPDARLLYHANAVLPIVGETRPEDALTLVRILLRHASLAQITLQPLAVRRPNEIADLLLASENRALVHFDAIAHKLTPNRFLSLMQRQPGLLGSPAVWMRRVPSPTRRDAYGLASLGWRNAEGVLDLTVAALLPGELRAEEGRRHLALPVLATRPAQRLPYVALLPWDEARSVLDPAIHNPDADLRAAALAALIGAARYQRERLPEALAVVRARSNEQDPVRRAMLSALAGLPPGRWAAPNLDDLSQIIREALSAADLSPATASVAEMLVVALVPFHPDWAAAWLGTLAQERGQVHFHDLGDRLSDEDVRRIAPTLLPVLASWETREREGVLLGAASSLWRRLRVLPELVEMLERVLAVTPHSFTASQALELLARHRRDRLAALIPALVQQDASSVTLPVVYQYLHRQRQDLLTPFLGQNAYSGRFSTGRTRFVLPLTMGFERWTPAQQETFAETLDRVTHDTARDTPSIFLVIGQLAALPAVVPMRLIALADRRMQKLAVRDAALRALARLDAGQGVPTLLAALDDERARIAIYALRTTLLEMHSDRALALLRDVPMGKVTVAKEVVRLLGELRTPDAYPSLLALDGQEMDGRPLHRDVRVALLRALWDHLEDDQTWPVLERAATDPDPAIAAGVVRIPTNRLSPLAQRRLVALIAVLLAHPDAKVRLDVLARCFDLPLPDPEGLLLPRLLACMGSCFPDEFAAAARAVFATYGGDQADVVADAIRAIRANRPTLRTAADALHATLALRKGQQLRTVQAVISALEGDPLTATIRAQLAVAGLPWEETVSLLARMAASEELYADALMAAVRALETAPPRAEGSLDRMEKALAHSTDERLRRLALAALIAQAGAAEGWTEDRRHRLENYRQDPASLVAAAAQFTFPPDDSPSSAADYHEFRSPP
jgi:hypothetical protein